MARDAQSTGKSAESGKGDPKQRTKRTPKRALIRGLILAVLIMGASAWFLREPPAEYRTVQELLAMKNLSGMELVDSPPVPGPYVYRQIHLFDPESIGRISYQDAGKLKTITAPQIPGYLVALVMLDTPSHEQTYMVVKKKLP